ncbi:CBS domain-containing protein [Natrinema sp. 1APR25-10V2]|uniref:CBS domain-containing protein n=1 Tax=Natrinema sp. 1APR25-10V2 TaxID=2951081 RepID=UPI002876DAC0|nr:CBS domain-containing protein [Natrinema sp. 1APR25-10V2]MDS0475346.1 CBS domain-containing protein [Natrinema sp. 1APR25-10V2]
MIETTVETVSLESARTISPETPLTEAAQQLRRTEVPALVVLSDESIVGIVTESDIVALVAETDEQPPVRQFMSTPVTTITPDATLSEAAETMRTAGVKHLPVIDDGVYRGLLSAATLAPYLSRHRLEIEWEDEPMSLESVEGREITADD